MVRFRRTVSFDDDVLTGLNLYRAVFLRKGKEKKFGPAVNELLREILKKKRYIRADPTFKEPCRFGGFCTEKKLYEDCINEQRMKNNWMCWRDGILLKEEEPLEVKLNEKARAYIPSRNIQE